MHHKINEAIRKLFSTKNNYWDMRYKFGGNSGSGSINDHREWKWKQIYLTIPEINDVIDVGCGDLSFWDDKFCKNYLGIDISKNYIGIDISKTIIERNKEIRKNWLFLNDNATFKYDIKADTVFCLDVLFHIMDDNDYFKIINNIMDYSNHWLVIYTWDKNPMTKENKLYQCYRRFPVEHVMDKFILVKHEKDTTDKYGAIYIFKRKTWEDY